MQQANAVIPHSSSATDEMFTLSDPVVFSSMHGGVEALVVYFSTLTPLKQLMSVL